MHSLSGGGKGRDLSGYGGNRPNKAHSQTGDGRGRVLSEHGKNRPSKVHSLSGGSGGRDLSGYGKKPTERGALTSWRRQREGLVRIQIETDRARCTNSLGTVEGGTCQDTERNRPSEVHSLSGNGRGRDLSGHGKNPTERSALTFWRQQREGLVRIWKEPTERGALTNWRQQREGLVRTWKEPTERGALTNWRRQRERLVRIQRETGQARCTHFLKTAEGGTCQDTERNRPSEMHSLPGDGRGRNLSEYG